jgi:HK97 family phage prohead protease
VGKPNQALVAARSRRRKERRRSIELFPEVRYWDPKRLELRAPGDDGAFQLSGSPIMYSAEYRVVDPWGDFVERIHAGSLTDTLARGVDCRLLLNHEGLPMARTTSGTMSLTDTPTALTFRATLDARQQLANDFYIAIQRRDLDQMSVGMIVGNDEWAEEGDTETRDIYGLSDLLDVSGVTYPASPSTSIAVAQRMALQQPIESRARARRLLADASAGRALTRQQVQGLRAMLLDADDAPAVTFPTRPAGTRVASRLLAVQARRAALQRRQRELDRKISQELLRQMRSVVSR